MSYYLRNFGGAAVSPAQLIREFKCAAEQQPISITSLCVL